MRVQLRTGPGGLSVPLMCVLVAAASCRGGCAGQSARGGADPRRFVTESAEVVFELSDWGALPGLRAFVEKRLAPVVPAEDIVSVQAQLQRVLGFNPLTPEGLASAGLPPHGRLAGWVEGEDALWVFPFLDRDKVAASVDRLIEARAFAEKSSATLGGIPASVYGRSFGEETSWVAAFATRDGLAFLALGPNCRPKLTEALELKSEASIVASARYRELDQSSREGWLVRTIAPRPGEALSRTLKSARSRVPLKIDEEIAKGIVGAMWALYPVSSGFDLQGQVRLTDAALEAAQEVFGTDKQLVEGLRQLDVPGAVAFMAINGDPQALVDRMAPDPSRARFRLRKTLERIGLEEKKVLANLTGQASLAMGLGDLAGVELSQLFGNPLSLAWTAIGLGAKSTKALGTVNDEMKAQLLERGFEAQAVKVGSTSVTRIQGAESPNPLLVDVFSREGAVIYANEAIVSETILGLAPGLDPLKGKAGLAAELRLRALAKQLASFDIQKIPLMFRSMVGRGLEVLALLDQLKVTVQPVKDGLRLEASLILAPEAPEP